MQIECIVLGVKTALSFKSMKTRQTLMKVKNYIPEEWRRFKRGQQNTLYRVPPNLYISVTEQTLTQVSSRQCTG